VFLPGFVFGVLRIVEVEGTYFTNHKSLHTGLVTFLGYQVGFFGYFQLLGLVIEVCHQQEDVLIEIHLFLADFGKYHFTVALGHPHLATTFSPVEDRYFYTDFDNLVIQQILIGRGELIVLSCIANAGKQVYTP